MDAGLLHEIFFEKATKTPVDGSVLKLGAGIKTGHNNVEQACRKEANDAFR
jgi:hypothetical protein